MNPWTSPLAFMLLVSSAAVSGFSCKGLSDGIYDASCQSFVNCTNGTAHQVECHKPLVVNLHTGKCDNPFHVDTPCGTFRDCSFRDDGNHPDLDRKCVWYFTCTYGLFYGHHKCPDGLVLNEALQACDFPSNVSPPCGSKTT